MKRFHPFLFAILGTLLALGLTFVVMRTHTFSIKPREIHWRDLLGRAEGVADLAQEAAA